MCLYRSTSLKKLVQTVLSTISEQKHNQEYFEIAKRSLQEELQNQELGSSLSYGHYQSVYLTNKPFFHRTEYLQTIEQITYEDLLAFYPTLFAEGFWEVFLYGNFDYKQAAQIRSLVGKLPIQKSLPTKLTRKEMVMKAPVGQTDFDVLSRSKDAALIQIFQADRQNKADQAPLMLLEQWADQSFFQQLRTEQQLGYIVHAGSQSKQGVNQLIFYIQSPTNNPLELQKKVNEFLSGFRANLAKITQKDFEESKAAFLQILRKEPATRSEQKNRLWTDIANQNFDFDSRQYVIDSLEKLQLSSFLEFAQNLLSEKQSRQLVTRVWDKDDPTQTKFSTNKDLDAMKEKADFWTLYPAQ